MQTQLNPSEISELIKHRIEKAKLSAEARNEGTVTSVADGIVRIYGLADAMQGEMIELPAAADGSATYALALNLERDSVGAVVLGDYEHLREGDVAKTTGRILEVPVGPELLGRVVNALGEPIDGRARSCAQPVERVAPGVIWRKSVDQPVQTATSRSTHDPDRRPELVTATARPARRAGHRRRHQPEEHRHQVRVRRDRPEGLDRGQYRASWKKTARWRTPSSSPPPRRIGRDAVHQAYSGCTMGVLHGPRPGRADRL